MIAAASILTLAPSVAVAQECQDRGVDFFETQGYTVRRAYVSGFWLLARSLNADPGIAAGLEGKAFTGAAVVEHRNVLRRAIARLPMPFESPFSVTIVTAPRLVNCRDTGTARQLDVEYRVFTTRVPMASMRARESREKELADPARTLALGPAATGLRVMPLLGYDASQSVWGGAGLEARSPWKGALAQVAGRGSSETVVVATALSGTEDMDHGWLRQATWRGAFEYADRPSNQLDLQSGRVSGQVSFVTAPVGSTGVLLRFGTLLEGGHEQAVAQDEALPSGSLSESRFANWRSYAGLSIRSGHQAFAASYGLLLGRTGAGALVDYRKHVIDVVHDTRARLPARRPLEISSRFMAGFLAQPGPTPMSERFFGGNAETPFMPGAEWVIRATPVLRGIPAYRLDTDRFFVGNVTLAMPVFGIPLIPDEASRDLEIRQAVDDLVASGVDVLASVNELDDPAQRELFETRRSRLEKTTAEMAARIGMLEAAVPDALRPAYEACSERIGDLAGAAANIERSTPWRMFINDDPEERGIPVIVQLCLVDLNGSLGDSELTRHGEELKAHEAVIAAALAKVDRARARRLAEQTMAFPKTVIQAVFDEMTVVSVSPVALFDIGRIGRIGSGTAGALPSARYSLGGGVRVTVASSMSLDLGYAWNLTSHPAEGPGALFFAMRIVDLFGK